MKLGLLQCDHVADYLLHLNGDYDEQFTRFLPGFEWAVYDLPQGHFPTFLGECDAYLCTGSKYSVYDDIPWILQLKQLVKEIYGQQIPFVGVCFGHQMMAHALGGRVAQAEAGWCVGVHTFEVLRREVWMEPFLPSFNILMSCQDQVLELPPDSTVLATTGDCPVGMYRVGKRMLGVQGHPEFSKEYALVLMEGRRERIGVEKVEDGIKSLDVEIDDRFLSNWISSFLDGTQQTVSGTR